MTVTATNTSTNTTSNTYTLVTGGTSGIGYQCAAQLIQQGKQVIITGQNPERVAKAATRLACRGEVADSSPIHLISLGKPQRSRAADCIWRYLCDNLSIA